MQIIKKGQKAVLVNAVKNGGSEDFSRNLTEMTELARAAGLFPVGNINQNLRTVDPAFLIGEGKREELKRLSQTLKPHYVVFDHILTGVQTRNLEKQLETHVLDRNQLILEIFARRAHSREGKLQVQLAQLLDQMPRMTGAWLGSLSRQGGRPGAKGPGEKALETDRRRAREKIRHIREKLKKVSCTRTQRRAVRQKRRIPSFALIGYTNSGKSALLNRLTGAKAETKNQPFMTLDPTTRRVFVPGLIPAVLTDTVGFIRNLPHHLIEAFKATLEEAAQADILLHIVDRADPALNRNILVVNQLMEELKWTNKPVLYVFNKCDLTPSESPLSLKHRPRVFVSAKTGLGIKNLLKEMKTSAEGLLRKTSLYFPKDNLREIEDLNRTAKIETQEAGKSGTICVAHIADRDLAKWKNRIISKN